MVSIEGMAQNTPQAKSTRATKGKSHGRFSHGDVVVDVSMGLMQRRAKPEIAKSVPDEVVSHL